MRKVFSSDNLVEVESLKALLEQNDIESWIKNRQGSSLAGEVPFAEVFPELWVLDDADEDAALDFLDDWHEARPAASTGWRCPGCGESHGKRFTACWQCGRERPS